LLRQLCVEQRGWIAPAEFEDAIASCNLLPGPSSTQLAIYCAWRLRGRTGALVGGVAFILPGLVLILALAALFLTGAPPRWLLAAAAGAGAGVAAVAVQAGLSLIPASWSRRAHSTRWAMYLGAGILASGLFGPGLVLVLLGCGLIELLLCRARNSRTRDPGGHGPGGARLTALPLFAGSVGTSALLGVAWVGLKVGALSYGGGFVIIPLMQADAVSHYHWMSGAQFLNAVALGQLTPGPVTQTVAVVGYAGAGLGGGLLAAGVAFAPSFALILLGAPRFDRLRTNPDVRSFLDGAGPTAIGAILGSSVPLALALAQPWQYALLAAAAIALVGLHRPVVPTLLTCAVVGTILVTTGLALPR
jgi:chromate transporter